MRLTTTACALFFLSVLLISCKKDKEESIIPEIEELYLFNLGSQVDAKYLGCGYENYEACGDRVKKRVRNEVGSLTTKQLIAMGNEFHENEIPFPITTHERSSWISDIIDDMRPFLKRNEFPYHSYTVASADFNAFTIPGGNIYVTTQVLDMVTNKDELAYIIGHELGHNENDHTKESARLYLYNKEQERDGSWLSTAKSIFTSLVANSCGKSDELECDISAMYLLDKAGYNAELALGGIQILKEISSPKTESFWEGLFFSAFGSHPWSEDRVNCVRGYVLGSKVRVECETIFDNTRGTVTTKSSPLGIRQYPIKKSETLYKVPKGESVTVICDCVEQEYRKNRDFYYIQYLAADGETYKGWVDKRYISIDEEVVE